MELTETAHLNENYLPIAGNDVAPDRLDCPLNHPSPHASARQARNNAKERKTITRQNRFLPSCH
jgi:hypothetical protein